MYAYIQNNAYAYTGFSICMPICMFYIMWTAQSTCIHNWSAYMEAQKIAHTRNVWLVARVTV